MRLTLPLLLLDDTPVATAKNMPGDSADLFGDGTTEDGGAANGRLWRTVIIGEQEHRIDLHMIRPYMKVVTHGGETRPPAPPWGSSPARGATGSLSVPLFEPQSLCLMHWDVKPSTRWVGRTVGKACMARQAQWGLLMVAVTPHRRQRLAEGSLATVAQSLALPSVWAPGRGGWCAGGSSGLGEESDVADRLPLRRVLW